MRKSIRNGLAAAVVGILAVTVSACTADGGDGGATTGATITVGIQTIAYEKREALFEQYEKESGNTLDIQITDDDQFDALLTSKLASGSLWDVFIRNTGQPAMLKYAPDANFLPLTDEAWVDRVSPSILPYITYSDNEVYAMPSGVPSTLNAVYNKKIFADLGLEIPQKPEDLDDALATIKAAGITPVYVAAKDSWPIGVPFVSEWANWWAANPDLADQLNSNEITWSEIPEFRAFLERIQKWGEAGYFNADLSAATYDTAVQAVAEGAAAITYLGDFASSVFQERFPDAPVGMFATPADDGEQTTINLTGPGGFYIAKNTKVPAAAKDFLAFLASKEAQTEFLAGDPGLSLFTDVESVAGNPFQADLEPFVTAGHALPHFNDTYLVPYAGDQDQMFLLLMTGQATVDQTLEAWDAYIQKTGSQLGLKGF